VIEAIQEVVEGEEEVEEEEAAAVAGKETRREIEHGRIRTSLGVLIIIGKGATIKRWREVGDHLWHKPIFYTSKIIQTLLCDTITEEMRVLELRDEESLKIDIHDMNILGWACIISTVPLTSDISTEHIEKRNIRRCQWC
jgi:hypothetical protein